MAASVLFLLPAVVMADARTAEEVAAAKAFKVEGVYLGMTETEFRELYPMAQPLKDLTDVNTGTVGLRVSETKNTDGVDAAFWRGRLLEYYVWYGVPRTEQLGGFTTLMKRLVEKFGKADADSRGANEDKNSEELAELKWRIPEADFYCELLIQKKINRVNITDMRAFTDRGNMKERKADVGF